MADVMQLGDDELHGLADHASDGQEYLLEAIRDPSGRGYGDYKGDGVGGTKDSDMAAVSREGERGDGKASPHTVRLVLGGSPWVNGRL